MGSPNHTLATIYFLVFSEKPKRLTEISKNLSISNSTAHRILTILKNEEWVVQNQEDKKYAVGIKLLEMAVHLVSQLDLRKLSIPHLEFLRNKVKETVLLSIRVGLERMYIEQIQCDYELRQIVELGRRFPLWLGAPGKVILAYMKQSEIDTVIDSLKQSEERYLTSNHVLNIDNLQKELTKIRNQGFSLTKGERIPGTHGIAAPIFGQNHEVIGSISTGGPKSRFSKDRALQYSSLLIEVAERISFQMGDIQNTMRE